MESLKENQIKHRCRDMINELSTYFLSNITLWLPSDDLHLSLSHSDVICCSVYVLFLVSIIVNSVERAFLALPSTEEFQTLQLPGSASLDVREHLRLRISL